MRSEARLLLPNGPFTCVTDATAKKCKNRERSIVVVVVVAAHVDVDVHLILSTLHFSFHFSSFLFNCVCCYAKSS